MQIGYNFSGVVVENKFGAEEDLSSIVKDIILKARKKYLKNGDFTFQLYTNTDIVAKKSKENQLKKKIKENQFIVNALVKPNKKRNEKSKCQTR